MSEVQSKPEEIQNKLGRPISSKKAFVDGRGKIQRFEGGVRIWHEDGTYYLWGSILNKWEALGGVTGFLGYPTTSTHTTPDGLGHYTHFQGGSIYSTPETGAHEVHGAIRDKWQVLGWEKSFLGYPLTDEGTTPDALGRFSHFQGGSIYWTPDTGAHEVHGQIHTKWKKLGFEKSFLGYPLTDEQKCPDNIGRYSSFQGGVIYWTSTTGACEIHGAILSKWKSKKKEQGLLGYPISDETTTPDGIGRYNHFQGGSIYWTPDTGAHEVQGPIRDKWEKLGWEKSFLGYPISGEKTCPDQIGKYNHFQGGDIYWTPNSGPCEMHGAILEEWKSKNKEQGPLGYPITDERPSADKIGRYNNFKNGCIYWSPETGTHVLNGKTPQIKNSSMPFQASCEGRVTTYESGVPIWQTQGIAPAFPEEGMLKIGYDNHEVEELLGYAYDGRIYRAYFMLTDIAPSKKRVILEASLVMRHRSTQLSVGDSTSNDGPSAATGLYILSAPIGGDVSVFDVPCQLYTSIPVMQGVNELAKYAEIDDPSTTGRGLIKIELNDLVKGWSEGTQPHYGFIITGPDENFNHNNNEHTSLYDLYDISVKQVVAE